MGRAPLCAGLAESVERAGGARQALREAIGLDGGMEERAREGERARC